MNSNNRNIQSDNDDGSFLAESYSQGEGGHDMDSGSWRHPHEESDHDEYVEGMLSLSLCSHKNKYDEGLACFFILRMILIWIMFRHALLAVHSHRRGQPAG